MHSVSSSEIIFENKNRYFLNVDVDDIRSFPQSKKLDEYGPRYVHTKSTDPFGEDQEFLEE